MLNDTSHTSLALLHPPHILALGCLVLAVTEAQQRGGSSAAGGDKFWAWLQGLTCDAERVYDVGCEMLALYRRRRLRKPLTAARAQQLLQQLVRQGEGAVASP